MQMVSQANVPLLIDHLPVPDAPVPMLVSPPAIKPLPEVPLLAVESIVLPLVSPLGKTMIVNEKYRDDVKKPTKN